MKFNNSMSSRLFDDREIPILLIIYVQQFDADTLTPRQLLVYQIR